jgi:glucose-6-phosphate dehydrogenase assembly protein OpcA
VNVTLEHAERELSALWGEETRRTGAPRIGLMTLVALVAELPLLERAQEVIARVVQTYPSRTIVASCREGDDAPRISASVALHRSRPDAPARGDAITLEAWGTAREWLPDNVERLALTDLPVCVWWVGDLPDFDRLFERSLVAADLVVVNSGEMDLRDLEKLADIAVRARGRYALSDLTWFRLRPLLDLIARFFDDVPSAALARRLQRLTIDFVPLDRPVPGRPLDVASTGAALLLGWIAHALALPLEAPRWSRTEEAAEVALGPFVARFVRRSRVDVRAGSVLRVALEAEGARFEIDRQDDPCVFCWTREITGTPVTSQTLRIEIPDEAELLVHSLERTKRDPLFEASLESASRIVRLVAPRLSVRP